MNKTILSITVFAATFGALQFLPRDPAVQVAHATQEVAQKPWVIEIPSEELQLLDIEENGPVSNRYEQQSVAHNSVGTKERIKHKSY